MTGNTKNDLLLLWLVNKNIDDESDVRVHTVVAVMPILLKLLVGTLNFE